jgi:oligoendopeptidase F
MNMTPAIPESAVEALEWGWERYAPLLDELKSRPLDAAGLDAWLQDWSRLYWLLNEVFQRLYVANTAYTTSEENERRYNAFLENVYPHWQEGEQALKEKMLASGLEAPGMEVPLRNMRAEAALFRQENVPLLGEEWKLGAEYDKTIGAQTIEWEGEERTLAQLTPVLTDPDRARRERAWRLSMGRRLADRQSINEQWVRFLDLRARIATNAGLPSYREVRWQQMLRFDYTPDDCKSFHAAIEQAVVPAVERLNRKRRARLGLDSLRPWDLDVDISGRPPIQPYQTIAELEEKSEAIFRRVDPALGDYFDIMCKERLLDLENRKGKAPGAYCTAYTLARRPFIFMNAVGLHDDVQTMLHEAGHAFHVFECAPLRYSAQESVGMEFAEVASMAMELLAAPYLAADQGGFYSPQDAARARAEHLESLLRFWPYMAVVDSFQHWIYEHPVESRDPAACDAAWGQRWERFMVGQDWSGLEAEKVTGWQRKQHIFTYPMYYVEYGLAQLGAVQVWRNALHDQAGAVAAYRRALALGGTVTLPELYRAAGVRLAFDAGTLGEAVELIERTMEKLEQV